MSRLVRARPHIDPRRLAIAAIIALAVLFAAREEHAAAQTTCYVAGPPGRAVPVCMPDPRDPGRDDVRPDRAALYCDFWVASGTVLPCPYSRSAEELRRPASEPVPSDDPVAAEQERGNQWRQRRD